MLDDVQNYFEAFFMYIFFSFFTRCFIDFFVNIRKLQEKTARQKKVVSNFFVPVVLSCERRKKVGSEDRTFFGSAKVAVVLVQKHWSSTKKVIKEREILSFVFAWAITHEEWGYY